MYHSREYRHHKNEKDGKDYHFRTKGDEYYGDSYIEIMSRDAVFLGQDTEVTDRFEYTQVNRQAQGMPIKGFIERNVRVSDVQNPDAFEIGDEIEDVEIITPKYKEEDAVTDGNKIGDPIPGAQIILRITIKGKNSFTTAIENDLVENGKPGLFAKGDVVSNRSGNTIYVDREIKGLLDIIDSPNLGVLEGGYGWFKTLTDSEDVGAIHTVFIAPFGEEETQRRNELREWIEETFSDYRIRAYAHLFISYAIKEKEKELASFNPDEVETLKKELWESAIQIKNYKVAIGGLANKLMPKSVIKSNVTLEEYADMLLQNAQLIESDAFITHLNQRLADFNKPGTSHKDLRTARVLAYEINRRTIDRDPILEFSNNSDDEEQYDRYNRILEGVIQIMNAHEHAQAGGFIVINRWAYNDKQTHDFGEALKVQFAGSFFSNLIKAIQDRIDSRGLSRELNSLKVNREKRFAPTKIADDIMKFMDTLRVMLQGKVSLPDPSQEQVQLVYYEASSGELRTEPIEPANAFHISTNLESSA